MNEMRKIQCKTCKIIKEAILDDKYPDNINKRWRDVKGNLFNGRVCPECHRVKMKEHIKKIRLAEKQYAA